MTKEEFRTALQGMIEDIKDENGELTGLIKEGQDLVTEMKEHDPVLASKFEVAIDAMVDIGKYVRSRTS